MAPTNVSFATALDLGAVLPISNTQSDINDAGVNYTVFYKFTCPAGVNMVWVWPTSDNSSGYTPKVVPYNQAQVEILVESTVAPLPNNPIQFPVTAGQVHYLQVVKNANSAGPEHVDLVVRAAPNTSTIPTEAIIINGDISGQPAGVFSPTVDYQVIRWTDVGFAFGEGGCIASSGKSLFNSIEVGQRGIRLYDLALVEIDRVSLLSSAEIRNNRTTGMFWVLANEVAGEGRIYKVDPSVIPLAKTLIATILNNDQGGISTNPTETIAYWIDNTIFASAIKRWNLTLDVAMSDLVANPGGRSALDTLALTSGNVVAAWSDKVDSGTVLCNVYDPTGILVSTVTFDSFENTDYGQARLAYGTDPNTYWVKLRERSGAVATGDALFKKINATTGAVLATVRHLEYHERNYIGPMATSYRGETGIWNSCPLVVYSIASTTPSGIFSLTQGLRTDISEAMPNPTFKTGLIP